MDVWMRRRRAVVALIAFANPVDAWAGEPVPASEQVPAPVSPVADHVQVRVVVSGMDAAHAARAEAAGERFTAELAAVGRDSCVGLRAGPFAIEVAYASSTQSTSAYVDTVYPPEPLRPHPAGRFILVGCQTVAAAAACLTWIDAGVRSVIVASRNDRGVVELAYACPAILQRVGPVGLRVTPATTGTSTMVPIYDAAVTSVLLERPAALPDGSPNATAVLVTVVGEAPVEP